MDIVVLLGIVALSLSLAAGVAGGVLYGIFSLMSLAGSHEDFGQSAAEAYLQAETVVESRVARPIAA